MQQSGQCKVHRCLSSLKASYGTRQAGSQGRLGRQAHPALAQAVQAALQPRSAAAGAGALDGRRCCCRVAAAARLRPQLTRQLAAPHRCTAAQHAAACGRGRVCRQVMAGSVGRRWLFSTACVDNGCSCTAGACQPCRTAAASRTHAYLAGEEAAAGALRAWRRRCGLQVEGQGGSSVRVKQQRETGAPTHSATGCAAARRTASLTRRARTTRLATDSATPLTTAVVPPSTKKVPALAPTAVRSGDGRMGGQRRAAAAAVGGQRRAAAAAVGGKAAGDGAVPNGYPRGLQITSGQSTAVGRAGRRRGLLSPRRRAVADD